jgi:hypothetical protein
MYISPPCKQNISTKNRRSAPPIPEGLGGGEAASERREQSIDFGLLLDVLFEDRNRRSTTAN